jgi:hypothetical protein
VGLRDGGEWATFCPKGSFDLVRREGWVRESGSGVGGWEEQSICGDSMFVQGNLAFLS